MLLNRFLRPLFVISAAVGLALLSAPHLEAGTKYKVLHSFAGKPDGGGVFAGVVTDSKGNLYGTTWGGGTYGYGAVFKLAPGSGGKWIETILHSFCANFPHCADGAGPMSTPVFDATGNLYGTSNVATFELSPSQETDVGWSFSVISDNAGGSSLTIDSVGDLYGAGGSVWELVAGFNGWKVKQLHIFCSHQDCRDGEKALAPPTLDALGNLYGTTEFGGGNNAPECSIGCGVVYQVQNLGGGKWKYQVLHRFAAFPNDGLMPQGGVTVDSKGNVYGTTLYAGKTAGTVFELSPQQDGHWKETILYDFPNFEKNGGAPVGGVTFDNQGNLYGTASAGGDPPAPAVWSSR
ncbi:MAG: choice-of-anchor tandem repeat GloVer-containing protein [Terriglobales bacterium]